MDCRPFCFCMNANNNTYSCVRTINSTHNFLYCEFTTGMVTFYNLRIDPFELQNRIDSLKAEERSYLHDQLAKLVSCKGKSCTVTHSNHIRPKQRTNMLPLHNLGQYYRKRNTKTKESSVNTRISVSKRVFSEYEIMAPSHPLASIRAIIRSSTSRKEETQATTPASDRRESKRKLVVRGGAGNREHTTRC
ncbi:unnamed protein product [Callosobruchus maculatus]|uniref:Sulfatase N-terminal domain-containing protein n=1 Tax=Callosobruchus maculatus TaxID=64391 RepID=A0A653DMQ2_CALMS|nr:unnamed protein product [Callosobruchus maculatus]